MAGDLEIPISLKADIDKDLEKVTKALVALAKSSEEKTKAISASFSSIKKPIGGVVTELRNVKKAVNAIKGTTKLTTLKNSLEKVGNAAKGITKPMQDAKSTLSNISTGANVGKLSGALLRVKSDAVSLGTSLKALKKVIKGLGTGHKLNVLSSSMGKLSTKVKAITTRMRTMRTASKSTTTALGKMGKVSLTTMQSEIKGAGTAIASTSIKAKELSTSLEFVGRRGRDAGKSLKKFGIEAGRAKGKMGKLQAGAAGVANSMKGISSNERLNKLETGLKKSGVAAVGFKQGIDQVGFSLFKTQQALTIIATLSGAAFAVSKALEFGRGMAEVSTLLDVGIEKLQEYKDSVLELSTEFGLDAAESAKALYQAISLGATTAAQANEVLRVAMAAAKAGVTSVEVSTKLITSTINSFGLSMLEAGDVSDSFFTTVKGGGTTMTELASSFAQVAPVAAAAGIKLGEINAAIADLTIGGTKTPEAITQLKGVITGLLKPSKDLNRIFSEFGSAQAAIKVKGLAFALGRVTTAAGGNIGKLRELVGTDEALLAVLGLTRNGMAGFNRALEDQADRVGATEEALAKFNENMSSRFDTAVNSITNSFVRLGEIILTVIVPVLEVIAEGFEILSKFLKDYPIILEVLTTAFIALGTYLGGTLLISIFKLIAGLGLLRKSLTTTLAAKGFLKVIDLLPFKIGKVGGNIALTVAKLGTFAARLGVVGLAAGAAVLVVEGLSRAFGVTSPIQAYNKHLLEQQVAAGRVAKRTEILAAAVDKFYKDNKRAVDTDGKAHAAFLKANEEQTESSRLAFLRLAQAAKEALDKEDAKKARVLAAQLKAVNDALHNTVDTFGVAGLAVGRFSKEIFALAKSDLSLSLLNNAEAITTLVTEIEQGLSKSGKAFNAYNTKVLANMSNLVHGVSQFSAIAIKRLENIGSAAANKFPETKTAAINLAKEISNTYVKAADKTNSMLNQNLTEYKRLMKAKEDIAKKSAAFLDKISSAFLTEGEQSKVTPDDRADQRKALNEANSIREKTLDLAEKIKESDSPEERARLAKQLRKIMNTTAETWETLRQKDPTFIDRAAFRGKALFKTFKETQAVLDSMEGTDLDIKISENRDLAKDLKDSLDIINRMAKDGFTIVGKLELANKDTIQDEISDLSDFIALNRNIAVIIPATLTLDDVADEAIQFQADVLSAARLSIPVALDFGEDNSNILAKGVKLVKVGVDLEERNKLRKDLEEFYGVIPASIVPELDETALDKVTEQLRQLDIKGTFSVGLGVRGATGGFVSGAGTATSDSISAKLSNGEFVMKAAAVKQYGVDFMHMINNMASPTQKFALGGLVSSPTAPRQHFAQGGLATSTPANDTVNLNLSVGGKSVELRGARDQVDTLVTALRSVAQGAG